MNTYQKVEEIAEALKIPYIGDNEDSGKNTKYITCNIFDERAELSADDRVLETSKGFYIHLFIQKDEGFFKIVKDLQELAQDYDFGFPEVVSNIIEGNARHITLQSEDNER